MSQSVASGASVASRTIPLKAKLIGPYNVTALIEVPSGTTVGGFRKIVIMSHPDIAISNMLFGGRPMRDENATLASFGVFKECSIQVYHKKLNDDDPKHDLELIKGQIRPHLQRRFTEDAIQFGDVVIIHVVQARNLQAMSGKGSNAYCFLTYGQQVQSGSVRADTVHPQWNETFGFFIDFFQGKAKSKHVSFNVYHNQIQGDDQPLGSIRLSLRDIPRNRPVERFFKLEGVGTGEVVITLHRAPITSPQLKDILREIVAMQQPWTQELLTQFQVTLGSFLGTAPWQLPDDRGKNPALEHLNQLVVRNQLDFTNARNVAKVSKILHSQRLVLSPDHPTCTLYLSNVGVTEAELFPALQEIVPNGVKSLLYNEPIVTIERIQDSNLVSKSHSDVSGYACIQFKSSLNALRALLALYLQGIPFDAAFGAPKEPDDRGQIGAHQTNLIEGLMQVSTPEWRRQEEEEKKSSQSVLKYATGEFSSSNEDSSEYPYFWVVVSPDTIVGYDTLHSQDPSFQLSITEVQMRPAGAFTLDMLDPDTGSQYSLRSNDARLLALWRLILSGVQDGSIHAPTKSLNVQQRAANPERWLQSKCWLSKKDLAICKLYSPDGHKWWADRKMLNQYVKKSLEKNQLDQITTRFTVSDLKDIIPEEMFAEYSERSLKALLDKAEANYVRCPDCQFAMEVDVSPMETLTPEEENTLKKLTDDTGRAASVMAQRHFFGYRILCRNEKCLKDFCRECWEMPYHSGYDCEGFRSKKSAVKCRFCDNVLSMDNRVKNPDSRALADVCTEEICLERMKDACTKTLECGHPCFGVRDEIQCPPCLVDDCDAKPSALQVHAGDFCNVCFTDAIGQAPAVLLSCGHVFHYQCLKKILDDGWKTPYISFEFSQCPLCKEPVNHEAMEERCGWIRHLETSIRQMALQRLRYEGKQDDPKIKDPNSPFYNDEIGFAEDYYAFFMCFECKKPYFGGAKECGDQDAADEVDKKDLLCGKCQKIESVNECKEHGDEYLAYKCRYCCSMSVFHCWGKVHFCRECHQPGVWDKFSTYSTGKNKKGIEDYAQCPSLKRAIDALMLDSRWKGWSREEKDQATYTLRANPDNCPLGTVHPPNGFEFGLGCTLCADKKTEAENLLAKERVEKEMREKLKQIMWFMDKVPSGQRFIYRAPMDENGILYFFGTHGKTRPYQNPADQGMVTVLTSQMMPDSAPYAAFVGRKVVRCVTKPGASCWFSVDFTDKYIKPTHYTLRHYISWDTECIRNWVIEGSLDGERWLVLRQHNNDAALNHKGQAYTWALHDYGCAFRRFRIKQTGPNNNNHYFLACSGFEIYGTLFKESEPDILPKFMKAYNDQQKMKHLSLVRFWQMLESGQAGVYHFTYDQDFDDNGILYFLGTKGHQDEWHNPALRDEVSCSSSSLVKDGDPIHYLAGRETVRLVTKPEDNAWMQIDFKDKLIQPSYYTLRHYSSWDTECLRNWILQASNDGVHWITVKKHDDDQGLNEKGATHTWPVQGRGAYRIWRIKQTGLNSNKHKYLACSGIEFYGQLYLTKFDPLASIPNRAECEKVMQSLRFARKCAFKENNDKNGVIYWIGTRGGTSNWVNPGARQWVRCEASSLMRDSQPAYALCGRISVRCVTQPLENSWFSVDLKNLYVVPTHYSLRHYISWDTEALRNWVLEASVDGRTWAILRAHREDASLDAKGKVATWDLRAKGARYRAFRIRQIGLNSNKHLYNSCSGFEVYGDVYQIGFPHPRQVQDKSGNLGEAEAKHAGNFDPSLTGQVPWDNQRAPGAPNAGKGTRQAVPAATADMDDEDQDLALLREMARQEKQRLIHHLSSGNPYPFYYTKDFDEGGILYFLGSDWRTAPWKNPAEMGVVSVTSSRLAKDSAPATAICGRQTVRCVCMAEKNNWFMVDFRTIYVRLTHYTIRHYDTWDTECLRNWYLEGSNDLKRFRMIHQHKNDMSLYGKGSTHTWPVDTKGKRYRAFRIRQYDKNSNKHWYLACSGVEFYGEIYFRPK